MSRKRAIEGEMSKINREFKELRMKMLTSMTHDDYTRAQEEYKSLEVYLSELQADLKGIRCLYNTFSLIKSMTVFF